MEEHGVAEQAFLLVVEKLALIVEAAGVAVIVLGFVIVTALYLHKLAKRQSAIGHYPAYRYGLGRRYCYPLNFWLPPILSAPSR